MSERADDPRENTTSNDRSTALNEARRRIENLEIALHTSRRIGVAVGILMSRHGMSEEQGFTMLAEASQLSNRKLRDIAEEVAYEGDLPGRYRNATNQHPDADLGAVG